jgi:hypothetical protein
MEINLTLQLRGELAEAFFEEWQKRLRQDPKLAKTKLARMLISERLVMMGYRAEDPMEWGGYRVRDDEEQGEAVAV